MARIRQIGCTLGLCVLFLTACGSRAEQKEAEAYARASLFCDVGWWEIPVWQEEAGTITGDISERTGLALDIIEPTQKADTQLKLMLLNDELPDIISVTDSITISQLVTSGKVWRLDEFLETYRPDSHLLQDFPEDVRRELVKRDGGWYAFPSHINSADARQKWKTVPYMEQVVLNNDNNAIMWNRKLLNQMGLSVENLQTQEAVFAAFETALEKGGDMGVIPLLVDGKNYQDPTLKFLEGTFGAEWIDDEGNYIDILLQPQSRNALAFLNTAVRRSYMQPEQLTLETSEVQELMQGGKVLCFIGNIANTNVDYIDWVSSGVILSPDGSTPVAGKNMRATTGWISTFIAKDCKNPEEIAVFLDYMTSEEGLTFWNYGYEGTDYYVGEDGYYYRINADAPREYMKTGMTAWWMFSNTAWDRSVSAEQNGNKKNENSITTAYNMHEKTVQYDYSLLLMPADLIPTESEEGRIEKEIDEWKSQQILRVVLAKSEGAFEAEYETLIRGLYDRGITQLDQKKNEGYQQNCREYGNRLDKINKGYREAWGEE